MGGVAAPLPPKSDQLSFAHWQVWGVLLCALLSGYLSLHIHFLAEDQVRVSALIYDAEGVAKNAVVDGQPQTIIGSSSWIVEIARLVPQLKPFVGPPEVELETSLHQVQQRLAQVGSIDQSDEMLLRQDLHILIAQLRHQERALIQSHTQITHIYYAVVLAFVAALFALVRRRRTLVQGSPLKALLDDALLFAHAPVSLSIQNAAGRLLRVNSVYEDLSGYRESELTGTSVEDYEVESLGFNDDLMRRDLLAEGKWVGEYSTRGKNGEVRADKVMRLALGDRAHPEGYLTMSLDSVISEDERRLMLWQAHHDNLTKLPNADLFQDQLSRALLASQQEFRGGALISFDLDKFKAVNDSIGAELADRVLTDAAYRIVIAARETDTLARVGGDRFVMLLSEIDEIADAERVARTALEAFAEPFPAGEEQIRVTVSAGIVVFPGDGMEEGTLLRKADAALLAAKSLGGNQLKFFEEQMNVVATRRLAIETHLRRAIANDEFELHYQPVVDISRDYVYGVEALLRWHNDELGSVSPAEFIPIAEESGLIVDIGYWVVDAVQAQLTAWKDTEFGELKVSLNVSARQFKTEACAQSLLAHLDLCNSEQMIIELTESALVRDHPGSIEFLDGLQARGLPVALDDFGTGYSSVGYIRDFEFDVLKIDKSFIDGIDGPRDHGLVASIIAMGRILGMRVVAEGVEEGSQVELLRQIGCDFVQGYHFSKPLPVADLERYVRSQMD